jgi:hypothetical protein
MPLIMLSIFKMCFIIFISFSRYISWCCKYICQWKAVFNTPV